MASFLFGSAAALLAYHEKIIDIHYFIFIMSFVSMQLVEFFIWIYMNNSDANRIFSQIGYGLIALQPFFMLSTLPDNYPYKSALIYAYLLLMSAYTLFNNHDFRTAIGKNRHLEWKWLRWPGLVLLIWMFFFIFPSLINERWITLAVIVATALYSYKSYVEYGTWGSIWCWIASIVATFYLGQVGYKYLTGRPPIDL